jgi:hypothetical protein
MYLKYYVYACVYVYGFRIINVRIYVVMYVQYVCMYVDVCIYVCVLINMYTYTHICMFV